MRSFDRSGGRVLYDNRWRAMYVSAISNSRTGIRYRNVSKYQVAGTDRDLVGEAAILIDPDSPAVRVDRCPR